MAGIYDQEILGAAQQQETARKLREGIKAPEGQMVSGWYVQPSITQYMAEALKGYYAGKQGSEAQSKYDTLTKQKSDETQRYADMLMPKTAATPTPEQTMGMGQPMDLSNSQPNAPVNTTTTQPSEQQMMSALLGLSQVNPEAAGPALAINQWQTGRQDKQAAAKQAQQDKLEQLHQAALDRAAIVQAGGGGKPYYQFLPTAEGYAIGNARTGQINAPGTGGVKALRSTDNPALQQNISTAKAQGAADVKRAQEGIDAGAKIPTQLSPLDRMGQTVDEIINSKGLDSRTGLSSYVPEWVQGDDARNTEALMTVIKSQVAQNVLQMYRNMSQTGGAVGQVSNFEQEMFQNNLAALKQSQTKEQFEKQLGNIKTFVEGSKQRILDAYNKQYGGNTETPNIDALLQKYGH